MRTEVKINIYGHCLPGDARRLFQSVGCGPDVVTISKGWRAGMEDLAIQISANDKRLPGLRALFERHGQRFSESFHDIYTEEELNSARLLAVSTHNDVEVFAGPRLGTTYDMANACPSCGAGARQTSAMVIDKEYVKTLKKLRATATCYEDMLVDERLAAQLASSGLTGFSFRDVYSAKYQQEPKERLKKKSAKTKLPWQQVIATFTMPPMSPLTTGLKRNPKCTTCTRAWQTTTMGQNVRIVYRAQDLIGAQDFNTTWEWFGEIKFNGDVSDALFPYPMLLVTPKVMRFFRDAGVESFDWIPIRVVDE